LHPALGVTTANRCPDFIHSATVAPAPRHPLDPFEPITAALFFKDAGLPDPAGHFPLLSRDSRQSTNHAGFRRHPATTIFGDLIVWGVVAFGYAAAIAFGLYRGRKHTAVEPVSATN
jgi:hypothetical protein